MNVAAKSNQIYIDRVRWFQEQLTDTVDPVNDEGVRDLVQSFINREDEELAELKAAQRPGRPPSKAEENILSRKDVETKQFNAGFWAPDIKSAEGLEKLQRWGGSWGGLNTLSFIRVKTNAEIKSSTFPPKSLSWRPIQGFPLPFQQHNILSRKERNVPKFMEYFTTWMQTPNVPQVMVPQSLFSNNLKTAKHHPKRNLKNLLSP